LHEEGIVLHLGHVESQIVHALRCITARMAPARAQSGPPALAEGFQKVRRDRFGHALLNPGHGSSRHGRGLASTPAEQAFEERK
jgi:hypothetical protein